MKHFRRYSKQLVFGFLACTVCVTVHAQDASCPRDILARSTRATIKSAGGVIEPVHLGDGLAVVITAKTKKAIQAIHKALDAYTGQRLKPLAISGSDHCWKIMDAVSKNRLVERVEKTAAGALLVYTSSDRSLISTLQTDDCCKWCVCPTGTVTSCAKCCG